MDPGLVVPFLPSWFGGKIGGPGEGGGICIYAYVHTYVMYAKMSTSADRVCVHLRVLGQLWNSLES